MGGGAGTGTRHGWPLRRWGLPLLLVLCVAGLFRLLLMAPPREAAGVGAGPGGAGERERFLREAAAELRGMRRELEQLQGAGDGVGGRGTLLPASDQWQQEKPPPAGSRQCREWAKGGECERNRRWMEDHCGEQCEEQRARSEAKDRARVRADRAEAQAVMGATRAPIRAEAQAETRHTPSPDVADRQRMTSNLRRFQPAVRNNHERCQEWADMGECQKNPWMIENCLESCSHTPAPPPEPPLAKQMELMADFRKKLPDPEMDCLYMHGVGMRDPGGGGAFKLWYKGHNNKPVWIRKRPPAQGGQRMMYTDKHGQWVVCTVESEMAASQGSILGKTANSEWPWEVKMWQSAIGGSGWKDAPDMRVEKHTLRDCADRPHVQIPPALKALQQPMPVHARDGIDYHADYEIPGPKMPGYDYPNKPIFRYPEDNTQDGRINISYQILSYRPRIYFFPNFATPEECDAVIEEGTPLLKRSTVGNDDVKRGTKAAVSNTRTSRNAWLDDDHPGALVIRERILAISGLPNGGHEQMQVLRYEKGQEYQVHHDGNKRVITTFVYLSTPDHGGYTNWPVAGGRSQSNNRACETGLFAHPRKGAAVFFYDLRPDLSSDGYASHAACPVGDGVKWGGTFWLHLPAAEREDLM